MPDDALHQNGEAPEMITERWGKVKARPLAVAGSDMRASRPERVRLRLDVPQWLREETIRVAGAEDTSISQLASFLLAYALVLYEHGDPDLLAQLQMARSLSRSLRWGHDLDVADLAERFPGR